MKELLSKYIHELWCNWMEYQIPKVIENPNNELINGETWVQRWTRQMHTPYEKLSEAEKESDRVIAQKIIDIFLIDRNVSESEA